MEIAALTTAAIARADELVAAALTIEDPTFEELFGALDDAAREVATAYGQGAFLCVLAPEPDVRAAAFAAKDQIDKWRAAQPLRPDLAAAIERFVGGHDLGALAPDEASYVRRWEKDVRLAGGTLPAAERTEVQRLTDRLIELSSTFQANLLEAPHLELTSEEVEGVSPTVVATFAPGSRPGTFDVPVNQATIVAFLEGARRRDVRERIDRVWLSRGAEANGPLLEEILATRRRLAGLLGYPSWLALRAGNLAGATPEFITEFILGTAARLAPIARQELEAMRALLAHEEGWPATEQVADWDWRFADQEQKAALGARPDLVREYFELDGVLAGLGTVTEELVGVRLVEIHGRPAWHPDVRAFDLIDVATGQVKGHLFLDPHVRDGKAGGAYADPMLPGPRRSGDWEAPTLVLQMNLPARGDGPTLLGLEDVEVLFHEYGHVLDFTLGPGRFVLGRETWVPFDFIEGPSQFLGRWGVQPEILARVARHHLTGEPLPDELVRPLVRTESLNAALRALRQLSMARLDNLLHGEAEISPEEADRQAWSMRGMPYPDGTSFVTQLGHLTSGYDAALYGYVWAEVVRDDLLAAVRHEGLLSPVVGARYRRTILESPWTADPVLAVAAFLGRPWSIDAFIARVEGGRH